MADSLATYFLDMNAYDPETWMQMAYAAGFDYGRNFSTVQNLYFGMHDYDTWLEWGRGYCEGVKQAAIDRIRGLSILPKPLVITVCGV